MHKHIEGVQIQILYIVAGFFFMVEERGEWAISEIYVSALCEDNESGTVLEKLTLGWAHQIFL